MAAIRTQKEIRQRAPVWLGILLLTNLVIMAVDAQMPYHVIISVMDALRQNNAKDATYPDNLLFPDIIFSTGIK